MAITTYAELQTAVAAWVDRSDLTARIPEFIALAEAAMNRDLRVRQMQQRDAATISSEYATTPSDFIGVRSYAIDDDRLQFLDIADLAAKADSDSAVGQPRYYTIIGGEFRHYPAPDTDYDAELTYWQKVPALSATNTSNWVLDAHPDAYLYGALLHCATFQRDADLMAVSNSAFNAALEAIRNADTSESFGDRRRLARKAFG